MEWVGRLQGNPPEGIIDQVDVSCNPDVLVLRTELGLAVIAVEQGKQYCWSLFTSVVDRL